MHMSILSNRNYHELSSTFKDPGIVADSLTGFHNALVVSKL
jgi:hypothetical protein